MNERLRNTLQQLRLSGLLDSLESACKRRPAIA